VLQGALDQDVPISASRKNTTGSQQTGRFSSLPRALRSIVGVNAISQSPIKMAGIEVDQGKDAATRTAKMSAGYNDDVGLSPKNHLSEFLLNSAPSFNYCNI